MVFDPSITKGRTCRQIITQAESILIQRSDAVRERILRVMTKPLNKVKPPHEDSLLMDRNQARIPLNGISYHQVVLLEAAGKLTPIRLSTGDGGKVFYNKEQVEALASGYSKTKINELKTKAAKKRKRVKLEARAS
jgi:hypothetical protein